MNARNNLKNLEVSSDSDLSEVEPFITQTKAALMADGIEPFGKQF